MYAICMYRIRQSSGVDLHSGMGEIKQKDGTKTKAEIKKIRKKNKKKKDTERPSCSSFASSLVGFCCIQEGEQWTGRRDPLNSQPNGTVLNPSFS